MALKKCKKTGKVKLSHYIALKVATKGKFWVYKCKYCGWRHTTSREPWKES